MTPRGTAMQDLREKLIKHGLELRATSSHVDPEGQYNEEWTQGVTLEWRASSFRVVIPGRHFRHGGDVLAMRQWALKVTRSVFDDICRVELQTDGHVVIYDNRNVCLATLRLTTSGAFVMAGMLPAA